MERKAYKYLTGKDLTDFRRELRKLFKTNRLQARLVYYDYYDSCHAPIETPNAEWVNAADLLDETYFKSGGPSVIYLGPGFFALFNGYSKYELRLNRGAK